MSYPDIDWEPPAPPARGTCDDCGRRRIVYDNGMCVPCMKEQEERYERDRQEARDIADGLYDDILFGDLVHRPCVFEFDGPGDDPDYCVEHENHCMP